MVSPLRSSPAAGSVLRRLGWPLLVAAAVAAFLWIDHARRCAAPALSESEALARGERRLQRYAASFHIGGSLPVLIDKQFQAESKEWLLTYKGSTCEVIIVVDRCHGDDVGSTTACPGK